MMVNNIKEKGNGLSHLLGAYVSDSDEDDEHQHQEVQTKVDSFLDEISSSIDKTNKLVILESSTNWTQCLDKTTGHPYYWNINTKDVTWEVPEEYKLYLEYIEKNKHKFSKIEENRWSVRMSEDTNTPYYVDEITRVVSWEMPEEYKIYINKKIPESKLANNKEINEKDKQKLVEEDQKKIRITKRKRNDSESEDEKIELITSYSLPSSSSSEDDKNNSKELPSIRRKLHKSSDSEIKIKQKHINKFRIVAEYSDDDSDDNISQPPTKTLFPTIQTTKENVNNQQSFAAITASTTLFPFKIYSLKDDLNAEIIDQDNQSLDNTEKPLLTLFSSNENTISLPDLEQNDQNIETENDNESAVETTKPDNSFLMDTDIKMFQRKRRIEIPIPIPTQIHKKSSSPEKDNTEMEQKTETLITKNSKNLYNNFQQGSPEFINSPKSEVIQTTDASTNTSDDQLIQNKEIEKLSSLVDAKVKFLSEGRPSVSGVQIMAIQLQTLLAAYEAKELMGSYLLNWLNSTSSSLFQLEKDVAPNGWKCKWDRKNSRYYYQSLINGKIQWEFPEPDITCAGDEMDISTTPPPNEKEQNREDIGRSEDSSEMGPSEAVPEPPNWDVDNDLLEPPPAPNITEELLPPGVDVPGLSKPKDKLSSELDSFYSDLATLDTVTETECSKIEEEKQIIKSLDIGNIKVETDKTRKKKKVKNVRSEMKEMSVLMAKWQKAQKDLKK